MPDEERDKNFTHVIKTEVPTFVKRIESITFVEQAAEKSPSAALRSPFVVATYAQVRRTSHDFARLASGHF
jgi:hypothetical protein